METGLNALPAPTQVNPDHLAEQYLKCRSNNRKVELELPSLPEFMRDYLAICAKHTDAVPGALLTAWLPYIAVNIGNRVYISSNAKKQYCHFWSVLVGPSTISRKSTCLRLASATLSPYEDSLAELESQEQMRNTLIINGVTNARLNSLLAMNSVRLLVYNEFGDLLKSATNSFNTGMKENLTGLYDGDNKTITNMERTERIIAPAISIAAASTEGWVYESFKTAADQNSGFLQRFIYCLIKPESDYCSSMGQCDADIAELHEYDKIFKTFRAIPGSHQIRLSDAEKALWADAHDMAVNQAISEDAEELVSYVTRIYSNVFLSLVIAITLMKHHSSLAEAVLKTACAEFFKSLCVGTDTVQEALYLCGFFMNNARPMLRVITEGGAWYNERRIVNCLAKMPQGKDTHSNIMNKLRIKSKDMRDCIKTLEEQSAIRIDTTLTPNAKKPVNIYTLLPGAVEMYQ